jgi:hypothetical protein
MSHNPYSPPRAPVGGPEGGPPDGAHAARFYTSAQIAVAAFLGGLIPAGMMMAANFRELGWRHPWFAIVGSVVATVGLFFFGTRFPQIPILVSTGLLTLIVYGIARPVFAPALAQHRASGGAIASWWRVIGLALLCAVIIGLLAVFAIAYLTRRGALPV